MTGEDDLGYVFPRTPSELREMSYADLAILYRKIAFANKHNFDGMIEREMQWRFVLAITSFSEESRASGSRIERLTQRLVWLTVSIVALTIGLVMIAVLGGD